MSCTHELVIGIWYSYPTWEGLVEILNNNDNTNDNNNNNINNNNNNNNNNKIL